MAKSVTQSGRAVNPYRGTPVSATMLPAVSTPKTRKPSPKQVEAALSLAEIGKEAAREAQRVALLAALKKHDWNLAAAGVELSVVGSANVLRSIRTLGLMDEYKAAKIARIRASR